MTCCRKGTLGLWLHTIWFGIGGIPCIPGYHSDIYSCLIKSSGSERIKLKGKKSEAIRVVDFFYPLQVLIVDWFITFVNQAQVQADFRYLLLELVIF